MQSIVAELEKVRAASSIPPAEAEAEAILGRVAEGKDAWGTPFVYRRKLTVVCPRVPGQRRRARRSRLR